MLVKDDTLNRIKLAPPGRLFERSCRCCVACLPARADPGRTEIDVLGMVFVLDTRRQQAHNVHLCLTAISSKLSHRLAISQFGRNLLNKLANNVAQSMGLLLSGNVAGYPA